MIGDPTKTRLFRSYRGRSFHSSNCTIIDVLLATLATPGIFVPFTIEGVGSSKDIIDAETGCSNPILELLKEAGDIYGPQMHASSIISMGSGRENPDVAYLVDASSHFHIQISIACEIIHEDLHDRTQHLKIYHRFNPGRDGSGGLLEWTQLSHLKTLTVSYLQVGVVGQRLDAAVSSLHTNREGVLLSTLSKFLLERFK